MNSSMRKTVRLALPAAAKAMLLSVGVPLTLFRLFSISGGSTIGPWWRSPDFFLRALLVIVGLLWLKALFLLGRDVRAALRGTPSASGNWSSRWAGPLATLALAALVWNVPVHTNARGSLARGPTNAPIAASSHAHVRYRSDHATHNTATALPKHAVGAIDCLADLAATALGSTMRWPEIASAQMDQLQGERYRFVDPSLLRSEWCLVASEPRSAGSSAGASSPSSIFGRRNQLEELTWLGLGVIGTTALLRRLRTLRAIARNGRSFAERLPDRDPELEALEARLEPQPSSTGSRWRTRRCASSHVEAASLLKCRSYALARAASHSSSPSRSIATSILLRHPRICGS